MSEDAFRRAEDAPKLFVVPAPGTELAVPEDLAPAEADEVVDGEIVRYRQPIPARRVLPVWIVDPVERRHATSWATAYARHHVLYYGARAPLYVLRIASYTPRGAYRVTRQWAGWAFDAEAAALRRDAVVRSDHDTYFKHAHLRNERVKLRLIVSGSVAGAAVVAASVGTVFLPLTPWALLITLLAVLGYIGRPLDRVLIERSVITGADGVAPRLTPSMVIRALGALGNAEINKALGKGGEGITFAGDPLRDGPGWRADVDLPFGVTAKDVIGKRDRLASGLRRPIGCVWPEPDVDEHEGRLILWVGDKPLNRQTPAAWPLLTDVADVFKPLPLGVDQRGRPVTVTLIFANLLIGSLPRMGKTFSLRVLLLALALDVTIEHRVFELKGTGDLACMSKLAHHYASGLGDDAALACLESLRELDRELVLRADRIKRLPKHLAPESKLTRAICNDRRLKLWPIVLTVDEAQNLFSHSQYGDEAGELAERIIKVGPAMGVILILATQRPDAKSLPTGISANVVMRFALKVMDQASNDMILGTSRYKNGTKATDFSRKDLGIGYLLGEGDEPQTVRTYYVDSPAAEAITDRALALRQEAGTVTGVAAGEVEAIAPAETLVDHALSVFRAGEDALWNEVIVARLAEVHPELYGEWDARDLGNALAGHGVNRRQLERDDGDGTRKNRRGVDRLALEEVTQKRP
ncbi:MAG: cell division protein FtsK/SpoIIIE [Blastococcus sp.]|nr:cell division protein FtsK/SpoIIIE [Blastococcus sp.]